MTASMINQPRRLEATTWGMGTECPMANRTIHSTAKQFTAAERECELATIAPAAAYVPVTRKLKKAFHGPAFNKAPEVKGDLYGSF